MNAIRIILWDFGDTLCDERFIWNRGPEWLEVYRTFDDGPGAAWCRGEINTTEFAKQVAERIGLSPEEIVDHLVESCREIRFFPKTFEFFRSHVLPQAIVTVNPDLFTTTIVPQHALDEACDGIVTSWEEGTLDKGELSARAIQRWDRGCRPAEALLIDNKPSNLDAWSARGGSVYHYTTDEQFARDLGPDSTHPLRQQLQP